MIKDNRLWFRIRIKKITSVPTSKVICSSDADDSKCESRWFVALLLVCYMGHFPLQASRAVSREKRVAYDHLGIRTKFVCRCIASPNLPLIALTDPETWTLFYDSLNPADHSLLAMVDYLWFSLVSEGRSRASPPAAAGGLGRQGVRRATGPSTPPPHSPIPTLHPRVPPLPFPYFPLPHSPTFSLICLPSIPTSSFPFPYLP